jgi:hypothetical protein
MQTLQRQLADRSAVKRALADHAPARKQSHGAPAQQLNQVKPSLAWADLLLLSHLLENLNQRATRRALGQQARADHRDTRTEYGGVVRLTDATPRITFDLIEPAHVSHDQAYQADQRVMEKLYTGLAHYHFHAQHWPHREASGPGQGDRRFIERTGAAGLIITPVNANALNVDYAQPGGVALDLGVWALPKARTGRD